MSKYDRSLWIMLLMVTAMISGCDDEQVAHQRVAKSPPTPPTTTINQGTTGQPVVSQRLLGGIVELGDKTWFFKLKGPANLVEQQVNSFSAFIATLKLTDSKEQPITWQVPTGWTQLPGSGMRVATLTTGQGAEKIELTVISLKKSGGGFVANINRWRGQIGLPEADKATIDQLTKKIPLGDHFIYVIAMTGATVSPNQSATPNQAAMPRDAVHGGMGSGMSEMSGAHGAGNSAIDNALAQSNKAQREQPITYAVPTGWAEQEPGGMRAANFSLGNAKQHATVTVIPLGGPAGGVVGNVNAWRGQVDLPKLDDAKIIAQAKPIKIDGLDGQLFEIYGTAGQSIVAALVKRGDATWFFKMNGSTELLKQQSQTFADFVQSVQFVDSKGGGS